MYESNVKVTESFWLIAFIDAPTQQHGKPVEATSERGDKKLYGKETRQIYEEYN